MVLVTAKLTGRKTSLKARETKKRVTPSPTRLHPRRAYAHPCHARRSASSSVADGASGPTLHLGYHPPVKGFVPKLDAFRAACSVSAGQAPG